MRSSDSRVAGTNPGYLNNFRSFFAFYQFAMYNTKKGGMTTERGAN